MADEEGPEPEKAVVATGTGDNEPAETADASIFPPETNPDPIIFKCGEEIDTIVDDINEDSSNSRLAAVEIEELDGENSLTEVPGTSTSKLFEADSISLSQSEVGDSTIGPKLKSKTPSRAALDPDVTHIPIQPSDIVEYEWPQKSGDRFFIQEQISELLGINSFKRKYPEMARRTVEPAERDYLVKELKLGKALPSHHLTALHSVDVHELMSTEYGAIYSEYQKACNERVKKAMAEKQRELEAIKLDAKKLAELREKAIKNAREFNSELQFVRKTERQQFWDTNTNVIHSPLNKWIRLSAEHTKPSKYPVFLLPGQYTDYYKKFDPKQLRAFPFGTVLENGDLFPPKRAPSPPAICITDAELEAAAKKNSEEQQQQAEEKPVVINKPEVQRKEKEQLIVKQEPKNSLKEAAVSGPPPAKMKRMSGSSMNTRKGSISWATSTPKVSSLPTSSSTPSSSKPSSSKQQQQQPICSICQLADPSSSHKALLVQCSACLQQMHSSCIDMPLNMVEVIRKYDWLCIDCKRCSVCNQPDQEAAMMCCDACDRGYHTFCIGLEMPPMDGAWHCPKCKANWPLKPMKRYLKIEDSPEPLMEEPKLQKRKYIFSGKYAKTKKDEEEEKSSQLELEPPKRKRGRPPKKRRGRPTNEGKMELKPINSEK